MTTQLPSTTLLAPFRAVERAPIAWHALLFTPGRIAPAATRALWRGGRHTIARGVRGSA